MTLPTTKDGGIDWAVLNLPSLWPEIEPRKGNTFDISALCKTITAHTRERCARWHIEERDKILANVTAETDSQRIVMFQSLADEHILSAAAIRNMKD